MLVILAIVAVVVIFRDQLKALINGVFGEVGDKSGIDLPAINEEIS